MMPGVIQLQPPPNPTRSNMISGSSKGYQQSSHFTPPTQHQFSASSPRSVYSSSDSRPSECKTSDSGPGSSGPFCERCQTRVSPDKRKFNKPTEMHFTIGKWASIGLIFGAILIITGSILQIFWPKIISNIQNSELRLSPGSTTFQYWVETPVPMHIDIYFFNWTNSRRVHYEKPHFEELGPYRFYEKRTKVDLKWNDNDTITYKQTRHWFFDEENSKGSLSDVVTTLNVVSLTAAHKHRFHASYDQIGLSFGLTLMRQEIDVKRTIEELLFKGYSDQLLSITSKIPSPLIEKNLKIFDKFGWFYKRNGSSSLDGVFTMKTGQHDMSQLGQIKSWNFRNKTGFFPGKCGDVKGGSGELFPPGLKPTDDLGLFSPDFCRMIPLDYQGETTKHGMSALSYTVGENLVDSGQVNPENSCYSTGEPVPLGLLNLTLCKEGAPMFVSFPHFYKGDPWLSQQVSGMKPDASKHLFHLAIEPTFGLPIDVQARFQINLMMSQYDSYRLYKDLPAKRYFMPIMWFDQRATLTPQLVQKIQVALLLPTIAWWAIVAVQILGFLIAAFSALSAAKQLAKYFVPTQKPKDTHVTTLNPNYPPTISVR